MGELIRHTGSELKGRWIGKMPPFFRTIVKIVASIAVTAITINTAVPAFGGTLYDWWSDIYTHILVGSICVIMVCKLTVAGGYNDIDPDDVLHGNTILDKDIDHLNAESPQYIEPYDDRPNA